MFPVLHVTQPCCLSSGAFESKELFPSNNGKYRERSANTSQQVNLESKTVYVRSVLNRNHAPKALTSLDVAVKSSENVATYRFWMEVGGHLKVIVRKKDNGKYGLCAELESSQLCEGQEDLIMNWCLFRDSATSFMPLESDGYSTMETPFVKDSFGRFAIELELEERLAPCYVSMLVKSNLSISTMKSQRKTNFVVPVGLHRGRPYPLGVSFTDDGSINVAFFSRSAESVVLCLYADSTGEKPALELDLDPYVNRTGDIWHALLDRSMTFVSYGYRCRTGTDKKWQRVLLDPYAKVIEDFGLGLSRKCIGKLYEEPPFDWTGENRPSIPMEKLIVYRLNVARFTKDKSSKLPSDIAGSFSGVSEKLHHFKDLGVNAVLLEPIFLFDEAKGPYFPMHFFSLGSVYGPSSSMKEMVKKLHAGGLEVFVEVVFTHTGENAALKEIDSSSYYHPQGGNDLNCNHPIVQQMILESLRYWVIGYHLDGFCFTNASSLMRGLDGEILSRPPLVEAIAFDPLLSKVKIIADSWDPRDMETKEAVFPHWKRWAEMNQNFCVDVRNFLRGQGHLSKLATRLCGSGDLFKSGRGPGFSFNFVTRNTGLTLVDLVSFSGKELESECSWNCGEEGPTNKSVVLETRVRQIRNFLFILFVSLGVPVVNMGDVCGQSRGGSAANTDRNPLDWNVLRSGFGTQITQFIAFLSSLKVRRCDLLQNKSFLKEDSIEWHDFDRSPPKWDDPSCKFLAMTLKVDAQSTPDSAGNLFLAFCSDDHSREVSLPPLAGGAAWVRLVDTALPFPGFFSTEGVPVDTTSETYQMKSHSCMLLEARGL